MRLSLLPLPPHKHMFLCGESTTELGRSSGLTSHSPLTPKGSSFAPNCRYHQPLVADRDVRLLGTAFIWGMIFPTSFLAAPMGSNLGASQEGEGDFCVPFPTPTSATCRFPLVLPAAALQADGAPHEGMALPPAKRKCQASAVVCTLCHARLLQRTSGPDGVSKTISSRTDRED